MTPSEKRLKKLLLKAAEGRPFLYLLSDGKGFVGQGWSPAQQLDELYKCILQIVNQYPKAQKLEIRANLIAGFDKFMDMDLSVPLRGPGAEDLHRYFDQYNVEDKDAKEGADGIIKTMVNQKEGE